MNNTENKRGRLNKSFRKFIDHDEHFSEEEQQKILTSFEDKRYQKIFRLSIYLLIWSIIGLAIDSTFIGGGVIASIMMGAHITFFLPTIIFSVVNFIIKFSYVRWYTQGDLTMKQAAYAGIPYFGSAAVLGFLLYDDPLFLKGLKHYLSYLRKRGVVFLARLFKSNADNSK